MYAKVRNGEIKGFTSIDDPYETPISPEITLEAVGRSPEECSEQIMDFLLEMGHLKAPGALHEKSRAETANVGLLG